jgi:hypothetical protein
MVAKVMGMSLPAKTRGAIVSGRANLAIKDIVEESA